MPVLGDEKRVTSAVLDSMREPDLAVADLLSNMLREVVEKARGERLCIDWTGLAVRIDALPDIGVSMRLRVSLPAEQGTEDVATVLNRALADAARRNRPMREE